MEWGTITIKDLVVGSSVAIALITGRQKVWCWFYQLEDCRGGYEKQLADARADFKAQLEEARASFRAQLEQARADFRAQIEASEARAEGWRGLVYEGRTLVKQSINATVEMAKKRNAT